MDSLRFVMTSTFFPPYHLGGDAVHVKLLKEELEARGHEVHVLHSIDAYRLKGGKAKLESQENVHPIASGWGRMSARGTYLTGRNRAAERGLARLIGEVRPDVVHHHNVSLLGQGILAIGGAPRLYTAHDYWLLCPRSDLMRMGMELCSHRTCVSCSLRTGRPPQLWRGEKVEKRFRSIGPIISPSRFMSTQLERFIGAGSYVLPNFTRPLEAERGQMKGHFVYAGVLEKGKGVDALLDAFARHAKGLELHVYGAGSLEQRAIEVMAETEGRVRYLGFRTGRPFWEDIASAAAMVMPSLVNDNCPLSCIEALSLGVPLIVSDRGGLPELTRDPDCGLVVKPEGPAIAAAVLLMAEDPGLRARMGAAAESRYERWHTAEAYMKSYLEIVSRLR